RGAGQQQGDEEVRRSGGHGFVLEGDGARIIAMPARLWRRQMRAGCAKVALRSPDRDVHVLRLIGRQVALASLLAAAQLGGLGLLYGLLGARLLEQRFGWLVQVCGLGAPVHEWLALGGSTALLAFLIALPLRRLRWLGLVHAAALALGG